MSLGFRLEYESEAPLALRGTVRQSPHEERIMIRGICPALAFVVTISAVMAQDEIRRGAVKALDADKGTITITIGGKDETFTLTDGTRVMSADGKAVARP